MKKKFRSLEMTAKMMINSYGSGSHTSTLKDSLIDIDVTRNYQPGDRKLDSKSSLRTSQTMSRVFVPDKVMSVLIVLDISASLYSKLDQAITSCLYLLYLADLANNQTGLVTFSDKVHEAILPSLDDRYISTALEKIYDQENLSGSTNLDNALLQVGGMGLTNTLIVLVSDFCYPLTDRTIGLAKRAGASNKMVALFLINYHEWDLAGQNFAVDFLDSESDNKVSWSLSSTQANEEHKVVFKDWLVEAKIKLRQAKIEPVVTYVDQSNYLMPLVKYFLQR